VLPAILFGLGFGFAAVVQPGPMQAFFLARVAQVGWRRTLPACLAPIASDGPIAGIVLLALHRVPVGLERALQAAGGILLIGMAISIARRTRSGRADTRTRSESAPHSLWQAVGVNILNPAPYVAWSLVLGPEVMRAWSHQPTAAVALIVAFYAVLTTGNGLTIVALGGLSALGPQRMRSLIPVSAAVLGVLGVYRLVTSFV
jgi:threonine/homoserine/homoserine lactone efflux protein